MITVGLHVKIHPITYNMKEFAPPINIIRPPSLRIGLRDYQSAIIKDDGRWYKYPDGQPNNEQHDIHLVFKKGEDINAAKNFIREAYRSGREKLQHHEMQKTQIDKQIIEQLEWSAKAFVKFFDGEPSKNQDLNRFHLLKPGSIEKIYKGKIKEAFFDPFGQCISVDRSPSDVVTAVRIGHEKFHSESPTILQVVEGEVSSYRRGLKTRDPSGITHLAETDEAITGQLNNLLFKETIEHNPLYEKELAIVRKIKPWIAETLEKKGFDEKKQEIYLEDVYTVIGAKKVWKNLAGNKSKIYKIDYLTDIIENPQENCKLYTAERYKEWSNFSELADKIITESAKLDDPDKIIRSREEVIDMFAQVKFTPNVKFHKNLKTLKFKIDEILGKGSFEELN